MVCCSARVSLVFPSPVAPKSRTLSVTFGLAGAASGLCAEAAPVEGVFSLPVLLPDRGAMRALALPVCLAQLFSRSLCAPAMLCPSCGAFLLSVVQSRCGAMPHLWAILRLDPFPGGTGQR